MRDIYETYSVFVSGKPKSLIWCCGKILIAMHLITMKHNCRRQFHCEPRPMIICLKHFNTFCHTFHNRRLLTPFDQTWWLLIGFLSEGFNIHHIQRLLTAVTLANVMLWNTCVIWSVQPGDKLCTVWQWINFRHTERTSIGMVLSINNQLQMASVLFTHINADNSDELHNTWHGSISVFTVVCRGNPPIIGRFPPTKSQ